MKLRHKKKQRPIKNHDAIPALIEYISDLVGGDITSESREKELSYGRMIFYRVTLDNVEIRLQDVADLTNRHYTTAIQAYHKAAYLLADSPWNWMLESAKEFLFDLSLREEVDKAKNNGEVIQALTRRIQDYKDMVEMITEGKEFGIFEDHEVAYRQLSEEQQANFRERVSVMLKMYK